MVHILLLSIWKHVFLTQQGLTHVVTTPLPSCYTHHRTSTCILSKAQLAILVCWVSIVPSEHIFMHPQLLKQSSSPAYVYIPNTSTPVLEITQSYERHRNYPQKDPPLPTSNSSDELCVLKLEQVLYTHVHVHIHTHYVSKSNPILLPYWIHNFGPIPTTWLGQQVTCKAA